MPEREDPDTHEAVDESGDGQPDRSPTDADEHDDDSGEGNDGDS